MKFIVTTTKSYFSKREAKKMEKFGFQFKLRPKYEDFDLKEVSYWHKIGEPYERINKPEMHFDSLEQLLSFQKKVGNSLIIRGDYIEIYNDFRE